MTTEQAKVMIVTGGSRGIGAGIAREAGRQGYAVCVAYASAEDRAAVVVDEIRRDGGTATAVHCNVSEAAAVAAMFDATTERLGPPTALINNAGVSLLTTVADATDAMIHQMIDTNLLGPVFCMREAARRMATSRGGSGGVIVNISSIAGYYGGMPRDAIYAGTKGGLDALTMGIGKELARDGIRVCGLRPGIIKTEIWDGELTDEEVVALGQRGVPLGRVGEVSEIARATLWLCSEDASYMTGTTINVSGGREIFVRA